MIRPNLTLLSLLFAIAVSVMNCEKSPKRLIADAGPSQRIFVGDVVEFEDAANSQGGHVTANWDFDWDFSALNIQLDSGEAAPRHVYAWPGVYFVRLEVTDEQGNKDHDFTTVEVLSDTN